MNSYEAEILRSANSTMRRMLAATEAMTAAVRRHIPEARCAIFAAATLAQAPEPLLRKLGGELEVDRG